MVSDPQLPAAELLLSDRAIEVLAPAVADGGGMLHNAALTFVDYTPGERIHAAFEAFVEWPNHGSPEELAVVARADGDLRGEHIVDAGGTRASVWRVPDDPYLPGLAPAHDPVFVRELLEGLGLGGGKLLVERLGYTPRSRAVVVVSREPIGGGLKFVPGRGFKSPQPEPLLYLKAMRPERGPGLAEAHRVLEGRIPAARCVTYLEELGLMAFTPLPGVPLYDCVVGGVHRPLAADELVELLDRIRDVPLDRGSRQTTTAAVRFNAETMAAVMPSQARAIERFVERLGEDRDEPTITVHGDFHEVQLLVGPIGLTGVLDLDDAGRGQRLDDLAMMLGRLYSYAHTERRGGEKVLAYAEALAAAWGAIVDPFELRRRMAGVAFNHALQAFRWQESGWRAEMAAGVARADELLRRLMASDDVGGLTLARP